MQNPLLRYGIEIALRHRSQITDDIVKDAIYGFAIVAVLQQCAGQHVECGAVGDTQIVADQDILHGIEDLLGLYSLLRREARIIANLCALTFVLDGTRSGRFFSYHLPSLRLSRCEHFTIIQ